MTSVVVGSLSSWFCQGRRSRVQANALHGSVVGALVEDRSFELGERAIQERATSRNDHLLKRLELDLGKCRESNGTRDKIVHPAAAPDDIVERDVLPRARGERRDVLLHSRCQTPYRAANVVVVPTMACRVEASINATSERFRGQYRGSILRCFFENGGEIR